MTRLFRLNLYDWFPWRLQQRILWRISFLFRRRYDRRLAQRMGAVNYQRHEVWDRISEAAWCIQHNSATPDLVPRMPDSWLSRLADLELVRDAISTTPEWIEAVNAWSAANAPDGHLWQFGKRTQSAEQKQEQE